MKAISMWQPWGTLLVHGEKRVETRSWALPRSMPCVLAIHAAKKWDGQLSRLCCTQPFREALDGIGIRFGGAGLPFGAVVGLVRVAECVPTTDAKPGIVEAAFGDFSPGRWAWVCDQFHAFAEPVPCVGRQGLFDWEPPGLELPAWAK